MANIRVVAGQYGNLVGRAASLTMNPGTYSSLYPAAALGDDKTDIAAMFSTPPSQNPSIVADLDLLGASGNFENTFNGVNNAPSGWVCIPGSGGTLQEGTIVHSGSFAIKLFSGGGGLGTFVTRNFNARAGEQLVINSWLRGDGTDGIQLFVQNLQTGNYLKNDGTWVAGITFLATVSSATGPGTNGYTNLPNMFAFTVEPYSAVLGPTCVLQVGLFITGGAVGAGYADDLTIYPAFDLAAFFGHNIDPLNTLQVRGSADNVTFTLIGSSMTLLKGQFYQVFGSVQTAYRYVKAVFIGTNSTPSGPIYLGEWVLGLTRALLRSPNFPWKFDLTFQQVRAQTRSGHVYARNIIPEPLISITLPIGARSIAQYQEMRDEVFTRTAGGQYPVVLIPDDTNADEVFHCTWDSKAQFRRTSLNIRETDYILTENPKPYITL